VGGLLAEGGEGRVFEVLKPPDLARPGGATGGRAAEPYRADGSGGAVHEGQVLVYKQLRQPRPLSELEPMVAFPGVLAATDAGLSGRLCSSSAWPSAAVVGADPSSVVGLLMPRAGASFWLMHRDGKQRLATLSYLASDPDRIDVAYGVKVPPPGAPERVAILYGLCRLLECWQAQTSPVHVVHGDLSAKNVLWSVQPTPAVFVLDCDGTAVGPPLDDSQVRSARATTPNWDDPARPADAWPTEAVDRYAIGLAFLRVVGAAHFPLQGRQRAADRVSVDLELPRSWRRLPDMPGLWELCERSLSLVNAAERPVPSEWSAHLEELLGLLGAADLAAAVRAAQGDPRTSLDARAGSAPARLTGASVTVPDVVVRPVLRNRAVSTWQLIDVRPVAPVGDGPVVPGSTGGVSPREFARRTVAAWGSAHQLALRLVRSPGRRAHGVRRIAGVLAIDLSAACVVLFLSAMAVSPWIGL
jgi:hypothetical protein